jgi:hypothetical protein
MIVTIDLPEAVTERVLELWELTKVPWSVRDVSPKWGGEKEVPYSTMEQMLVDLVDDVVDIWLDSIEGE